VKELVSVECRGCKRILDVQVYRAEPDEFTPENQIHRVKVPDTYGLSVQCPDCGHYTVYNPSQGRVPEMI